MTKLSITAETLWRTVAIVPVYGKEQLTYQMVQQTFREPVDVIVVDNRGDYQPILHEIVLRPGSNLGWLGGTNYGWTYALARDWDRFVLINNDVKLSQGFYAGLVDAVEETNAGIIGPYYNGNFPFQRPPGDTCPFASEYRPEKRYQRVGCCDGTAMLVTRKVVSRVGILDPTFTPRYGYGGAVNYCIRAKRHGFSIYLTEAAYCEHLAHETATEVVGENYDTLAKEELLAAIAQRGSLRNYLSDATALELPLLDT